MIFQSPMLWPDSKKGHDTSSTTIDVVFCSFFLKKFGHTVLARGVVFKRPMSLTYFFLLVINDFCCILIACVGMLIFCSLKN